MTLDLAVKTLSSAGVSSPEHDAREIFFKIGKIPRHLLVAKDIECDLPELKSALERRASGEPLQYILGEVGFYRELYEVSPSCLIPREDTEILVDYAVKHIPPGENYIDICTGSGCIAISTLKNTDKTTALAVELSDEAIEIAKRNAEKNGVSGRIEFLFSDALEFKPKEKVFAILSNPPYVTPEEYEALERELYHEPKMAFLGGPLGLDFYEKIIPNTKSALKTGGFMAFEIGKDQAGALSAIAEENGMTLEVIRDFSGNDRLVILKNQ